MEDEVIEPVIAVNDGSFLTGRDMLWQPFDEFVHRIYFFCFRSAVLLAPARNLALEIITRLAVVGKADCGEVHLMQLRNDAIHLVEYRPPFRHRHVGQCRVPKHPAFHKLHDEKRPPDHGLVFAQRYHFRYRHSGIAQRRHYPEFAFNCVC